MILPKNFAIDTPNTWQISSTLFTSGQVSHADTTWFANAMGVKSVLNLLPPAQELREEDAWWEVLEVTYDVIPMVWMQPSKHEVVAVLSWIVAHQHHPCLVHCSMNYRVAAIIHACKRIQDAGAEPPTSAWFCEFYTPNPIWLAFIDSLMDGKDPDFMALASAVVVN